MSFVAECEQCGILERGDFEDVGDAAEDHEQFHDVKVNRVATDGGVTDEGHLDYCDECVAETLHYRDETDGMWTCASCGRWSA